MVGLPAQLRNIENAIFLVRGRNVMLDRDLASMYGVKSTALRQQVARNARRFPEDFMFRLSKEGKQELITVCDRFDPWKHSAYTPMAFTEQGVAMLSSVLRSDRALEVNIQIMRAFVQSRQRIAAMDEIKERLDTHEKKFVIVFQAIRKLMSSPEPRKKKQRRIGFRPDDDE